MISVNISTNVTYQWERTACKEYKITNNTPATVTFPVRELTGPMITNNSIPVASGATVDVVLPRDGIYRVCNTASSNNQYYVFTFPGDLVAGGFVTSMFTFVVAGTTYSTPITTPVTSYADIETLAAAMQSRLNANGATATVTAVNHGTYYQIIIKTDTFGNTSISNIAYELKRAGKFTIMEPEFISTESITFCDYLVELCSFEPCIEELMKRAICGCDELPCDPCNDKAKETVSAQQQLDWLLTLVNMASMQSLKSDWASTGLSPYTEDSQSIVDAVELWNKITSFVLNCGKCPEPTTEPTKPCDCG